MSDYSDALQRASDQVTISNQRAIAAREKVEAEELISRVAKAQAAISDVIGPLIRPAAELVHHDYQPYANPDVNHGCVRCPHTQTHAIHQNVPPPTIWRPTMNEFIPGVVYTVGHGREDNFTRSVEFLQRGEMQPRAIVAVLDGPDVYEPTVPQDALVQFVRIPKHQPGDEQPRNVGVRHLPHDCTYVWFLDSDILVEPSTLAQFAALHGRVGDAILIGPYEWMGAPRDPTPELYNDPRWAMFNEREEGPHIAELGVALGCFGGNLVWPIAEFKRIGGFHQQLYHGRCEDGELGLRAASHRIPMALARAARGYHMAHDVNLPLIEERNRRDVPLLNAWHPWVQEQGLVVTDKDGARFDFICECGAQVNTLEMWAHAQSHTVILPEGA